MMQTEKKAILTAGAIGATILGIWALTRKAKAIPEEDIVLSDLVIQYSEISVGQQQSISAVATNIGETAGSYEAICEVV